MRKLTGFLVVILCLALYYVSGNRKLTREYTTYRVYSTGAVRSDRFRYGDLYGMSFLPYFRQNYRPPTPTKTVIQNPSAEKKIRLYEVCDSYIWSYFPASSFYYGVDTFFLARTNIKEVLTVHPDTSKINILLLEFAERNVRWVLNDSGYVQRMLQKGSSQTAGNASGLNNKTADQLATDTAAFTASSKPTTHWPGWMGKFTDILFNKDINTNIESNLWDYSFFTPLKECRAYLNYHLFGFVNKDVAISSNGMQLYYNMTVDTSYFDKSSFNMVGEKQLDTLVTRLNQIYQKALDMGFDKVYLSIIPNPVSILEPQLQGLTYNRLTERIQSSPQLRIPYIDLMQVFQQSGQQVYQTSDSHWNAEGATVWQRKFNAELEKAVRETAAGKK